MGRVRPTRSRQQRCSRCRRRCRGYDRGDGRRRRRAVDVGTVRVFLEAAAGGLPGACGGGRRGPWARPGARCTTGFEDTCAWLAGHADRLNGLRRIGIDEIAHRKGQRYLTVVIDHDTGWLMAARGRPRAADQHPHTHPALDAAGRRLLPAHPHPRRPGHRPGAAAQRARSRGAPRVADPAGVDAPAGRLAQQVVRDGRALPDPGAEPARADLARGHAARAPAPRRRRRSVSVRDVSLSATGVNVTVSTPAGVERIAVRPHWFASRILR